MLMIMEILSQDLLIFQTKYSYNNYKVVAISIIIVYNIKAVL